MLVAGAAAEATSFREVPFTIASDPDAVLGAVLTGTQIPSMEGAGRHGPSWPGGGGGSGAGDGSEERGARLPGAGRNSSSSRKKAARPRSSADPPFPPRSATPGDAEGARPGSGDYFGAIGPVIDDGGQHRRARAGAPGLPSQPPSALPGPGTLDPAAAGHRGQSAFPWMKVASLENITLQTFVETSESSEADTTGPAAASSSAGPSRVVAGASGHSWKEEAIRAEGAADSVTRMAPLDVAQLESSTDPTERRKLRKMKMKLTASRKAAPSQAASQGKGSLGSATKRKEDVETEKVKERLRRNREAAIKSRNRAKEKQEVLQAEFDELRQRVEHLETMNSLLKQHTQALYRSLTEGERFTLSEAHQNQIMRLLEEHQQSSGGAPSRPRHGTEPESDG